MPSVDRAQATFPEGAGLGYKSGLPRRVGDVPSLPSVESREDPDSRFTKFVGSLAGSV
jgi:hypothetical protein